jgi:hypothetical protein
MYILIHTEITRGKRKTAPFDMIIIIASNSATTYTLEIRYLSRQKIKNENATTLAARIFSKGLTLSRSRSFQNIKILDKLDTDSLAYYILP